MSLTENLKGLLLPATTPFAAAGELELVALKQNLLRWSKKGITGFIFLGSTGERVHLNEREYLDVIAAGRAAVSSELAFIVGAGQQSTLGTISEIAACAKGGADAVLVITPNFYRTAITQATLISYYSAVADASKVPVMLYSMPAFTGIKIEPETIARLSQHPNIVGVKDSSNDMDGLAETLKLCQPEFAIMTGNGTVLLDALKRRATGAILAVGCAVPEICLDVMRLFESGEIDQAESLQEKLTPFALAVTTRFGIGGLKFAMDLAGYQGGNVRAPLQMPGEEQRAEIERLLEVLKFETA